MKATIWILVSLITLFSNQEKNLLNETPSEILEIESYLNSIDGFSGVVLIAKEDRVLFNKAYGYAHLGHKVSNNINTKFSYASIGKSFTAVSIFQLIQAGKLSLDDNVGKFIPDYPNQVVRDSVTVRLLLIHRSGMPNYFGTEELKNTSKDIYRNMNDLASLYENKPMEFKPNERFSYRNTNYILLAKIIEEVSKISYEQYIEDNIFSIAGMKNTGLFDIDHPIENAAEGYTLSNIHPNKFQKNIFMGTVKGSAAGGGYTTADDLYKFVLAFKENRLLDSNYTNLMKTQKSDDEWYGYGMQFPDTADSKMYGHSGGHFGVGCEWRVYEKQNYTVIILTNKDADQGFLDARFYIHKILAKSTSMIDSYFYTKQVIEACFDKGLEYAKYMIQNNAESLSERDLNAKGYEMIKRGYYKKAIQLFKLEVYAFSKSYDAYDSLGEAYMEDGDIEKSIQNYEKSLELNSENKNAIKKLKQLSKNK
ncbi:serine hydrolase [Pontimicrobium sp. SW4]|uniref:Serine hydrolase n=1 Tax=Pontimicrobium sp. SW4 TaxID=3153519 RepID=A0AAU7BSZ7_9FLAO